MVAIVRQSMADIRRGKSNGKWLQRSVYLALQEKWKSDEEFLKVSERNKKNIAANTDGRVNHSGAISLPEAKRRLEKKLGKDVTYPELFETLNYDKSKDKWSTLASKNAFVSILINYFRVDIFKVNIQFYVCLILLFFHLNIIFRKLITRC